MPADIVTPPDKNSDKAMGQWPILIQMKHFNLKKWCKCEAKASFNKVDSQMVGQDSNASCGEVDHNNLLSKYYYITKTVRNVSQIDNSC